MVHILVKRFIKSFVINADSDSFVLLWQVDIIWHIQIDSSDSE